MPDLDDDYTQPGNLFRLMSDNQKEQLFNNVAEGMEGVPERVRVRQLVHYYKADPGYSRGVAEKLGLDMAQVVVWADLSLEELIHNTSEEQYGAAG